ncbi:hypothetical protein [Streptomyces sp. NPDC050759]|uniref:hypothetical protein n=1 Tax=Streptomyces sp. NPDC050759 TaxID=3365635 RepID=UPI0037B93B8E
MTNAPASAPPAYAVVVPTIGRPCRADCLRALAAAGGHPPAAVVMLSTGVVVPSLAVRHWLGGLLHHRRAALLGSAP